MTLKGHTVESWNLTQECIARLAIITPTNYSSILGHHHNQVIAPVQKHTYLYSLDLVGTMLANYTIMEPFYNSQTSRQTHHHSNRDIIHSSVSLNTSK